MALATPIVQGLNDMLEKGFIETNLYASQVKRDSNKRLNQGRVLLVVFFVPVAALLVKCDILLKLVGQHQKAVDKTQQFPIFELPSTIHECPIRLAHAVRQGL